MPTCNVTPLRSGLNVIKLLNTWKRYTDRKVGSKSNCPHLKSIKGGQAYHFGRKDYELGVGGEGQDMSRDLREVLGPCVQYCTCEASEQKLGQKPKSEPKEIWGEGGNRHFRHFRHRVLAIFKFLE